MARGRPERPMIIHTERLDPAAAAVYAKLHAGHAVDCDWQELKRRCAYSTADYVIHAQCYDLARAALEGYARGRR